MYNKEDLVSGAILEMNKNFKNPTQPPDIVEIICGPVSIPVINNGINMTEPWYRVKLRGRDLVMPEKALLKGYSGKYVGKHVNCMGSDGDTFKKYPSQNVLFGMWIEMLRRCYDVDYYLFKYYGGSGYNVSVEWLCFEIFIKQFKFITDSNMVFTNINKKYAIDIKQGYKTFNMESAIVRLFKDSDVAKLKDSLRESDILPPKPANDISTASPQTNNQNDNYTVNMQQFPPVTIGPVYNLNPTGLAPVVGKSVDSHIDKTTGRKMKIMCRIVNK